MIITREVDYALRIIRSLHKENKKSANDISKEESIPKNFLYKVTKKLQKGGVLEISRGSQGGYTLIKDIEKLNILDIITILGDEIFINECLESGYKCDNNRGICKLHKEFSDIQKTLEDQLSRKSLAEILK